MQLDRGTRQELVARPHEQLECTPVNYAPFLAVVRQLCRCLGRVAAIAPHSGTCWTEDLSLARGVSVCYLTGTADTLNPIEGGFPKLAMGGKDQGGRSKPPVTNMITKWAKVLECDDEPTMEEKASGVLTSRYGRGRNDAEVVCITIDGLGHHWAGGKSQAPEFLVGKNTNKLSATDVIWAFFSRHPAP